MVDMIDPPEPQKPVGKAKNTMGGRRDRTVFLVDQVLTMGEVQLSCTHGAQT